MDPLNTNIDLGDNSNPNVDTSSSINSVTNQNNNSSNINTNNYQSPSNYSQSPVEEVDLSGDISMDVGGSTLAETASNLASSVAEFGSKIGNFLLGAIDTLASTGAVVGNTIVSGVLDLGEGIVDGLAWCGGKIVEGGSWLLGSIVGWFDQDAGQAIKDYGVERDNAVKEFMAVDWIGKANDWFYNETAIGRHLNEASLMKYDSEVAQKMRKITEKAAEIAAATALTVLTGGLAAPLAVGMLYGMGTAGESTYQQYGTGTSVLQELGIAGSGVLTGLSWMATGKLGAGFLEIGKTAAAVGTKQVLSQISKDIITKEFWKNALKEGLTGANGVGNVIASAMMTGDNLIPYINGEKEWDANAIGSLALEFLKNLGLNVAEDALRGYIGNFNSDKAIREITEAASRIERPKLDPSSFESYDKYLEAEQEARIKELGELQRMIDNGEELTPFDKMRYDKISSEVNFKSKSLTTALNEAEEQVAAIKAKIAETGLTEELSEQLSYYEHQVEVYDDAITTLERMNNTVVNEYGYTDLTEYGKQSYEDSVLHNAVNPDVAKPAYVSPEMQQYADARAHSIRATAERVEATITDDLRSLEDESMFLTGERYRLKGKDSLSRKLILDASKGQEVVAAENIDMAADRIADSVRYTFIINEDDYAAKIPEAIEVLKAKGYEFATDAKGPKFRNSWKPGNIYQGVNTNFIKMIDGKPIEFEIQFHTPDSFLTKEKYTHLIYEIRRGQFTLSELKKEASRIQKACSNAIRIPKGIIDLFCN